jgi:hypothetical protein
MEGNKVNLSVVDGDSFFAHQASINFNPTMLFLDFKNITPRVDERNQTQATFVLKHNVVMLEPYHAVLFKNLFDKVIKDYEKQFGKIEKPEAIKKIEKDAKKAEKINSIDETPTYLG